MQKIPFTLWSSTNLKEETLNLQDLNTDDDVVENSGLPSDLVFTWFSLVDGISIHQQISLLPSLVSSSLFFVYLFLISYCFAAHNSWLDVKNLSLYADLFFCPEFQKMAEARTGCITILKWIWTQVKRRFSYMVENSQDNQVVVDMEASVSLPSSSSTVLECKYDVFLSFRGLDTRKGITFDIYDRLNTRGIKTFMDDRDLEVGDVISPTLIATVYA